ncbi:MAG: LemA family protein [Gemmatimonadota bacterium]|uniref:LemA family protein n=1 Tax=Candidatus Palauibacter scopulicola TaxID=3056741 RepID=UPI0023880600|nr:LemA family protein [Candidatus Palauibacter scopulicola]MDE2662278.1 LemA family protein [Candidatus Palauibacter scopulicola]
MLWFLVILAAVAFIAIGMYNSLVRLRVRVNGAWADIDVQLKRRWDLIPNLMETVEASAGHERETLEAVVEARNRAMGARGPAEAGAAEGALAGALGRLFALSEAYPQLRGVEAFTDFQRSLDEIEEAVQNARRYYNAVVRDYNTKMQVFPTNLIAGLFGHTRREFFSLDDERQREGPQVAFS